MTMKRLKGFRFESPTQYLSQKFVLVLKGTLAHESSSLLASGIIFFQSLTNDENSVWC